MLVGDLAGRGCADRPEPAQRGVEPFGCDRARLALRPRAVVRRRRGHDDMEFARSFLEQRAHFGRQSSSAEGLVRHHEVASHRSLLPLTVASGIRPIAGADKGRAAAMMPRGGVA